MEEGGGWRWGWGEGGEGEEVGGGVAGGVSFFGFWLGRGCVDGEGGREGKGKETHGVPSVSYIQHVIIHLF